MKRLAAVALLLSLACAGTAAPPRSLYLMRANVAEGMAPTGAASVALGRIEVAPYLGEPNLVLETAPGEVRPARNHLWAEPLPDGLRILLRERLARELGQAVAARNVADAETIVDVEIETLHGTADGAARLVARWRVTRPAAPDTDAAFRLVRTRPLARAGYAALVEAEIALADELAVAIADSLRNR